MIEFYLRSKIGRSCFGVFYYRFTLEGNLSKSVVIYILAGLTAVLVISNLLLGTVKDENESVLNEPLSDLEADSLFRLVCSLNGIEDTWIRQIAIDNENYNSLDHIYRVEIPKDIPVPVILKDMNDLFRQNGAEIHSIEKKINGRTICDIVWDEKVILQASLKPVTSVYRNRSVISLFVYGIEDLSESQLNALIKYQVPCVIGLIPSEFSAGITKRLLSFGKEFAVLINDNIDDSKYEISLEDSKTKLTASIINITNSFADAQFFVVDDQSELYTSIVYNYVRDEFLKRGFDLKKLSAFTSIDAEDKSDLISKFGFYCDRPAPEEIYILAISAENIMKIFNEITACKKRGNRFLLPSNYDEFNSFPAGQ